MKIIYAALMLVLMAAPASAQRWGHHHGDGGFGGAIVGGMIGGVLGGMMAPRPQPPQPYYYQGGIDPYQYCAERFRSWNPHTGLYLSYSGEYRRCP